MKVAVSRAAVVVAIRFMVLVGRDSLAIERTEIEQDRDVSDDFIYQMSWCGSDVSGISGAPIHAFDLISEDHT